MCGITGIFTKFPSASAPQLMALMNDKILHRGPDHNAIYHEDKISLGHVRLSIIDLDKRSNQPMICTDTGNVLVFNGEIYNYIELREELKKYGYQFSTGSDTEVILKAYLHWGIDCLNKFNGMWAFSLYDKRNQALFVARDRFGIKPFVYGHLDNEFVFASEAKAITEVFAKYQQKNEDFARAFIETGLAACYRETFYKNLYNLLPAHYIYITAGETPEQKRYWQWKPERQSRIKTKKAEIIETFSDLLNDSIKLRMRSDVTVGSCLSGGLDSSTIVALATKHSQKRLSTFSCIYPQNEAFDESVYIKDTVTQYNTNAYYATPQFDDYLQTVKDCIYEQDGPTGGPSVLSQRAVMQLAHKNVTVLLDGQGADELLGGYHGYLPYSVDSHNREQLNLPYYKKVYSQLTSLKKTSPNIKTFINAFRQNKNMQNKPVIFSTSLIEETAANHFDPLDNELDTILLEHMFTSLTELLHYEDRNSMRFSIESRLPFLDYRLVEYVFSLPHNYKIDQGSTKWLLRQVAQPLLPPSVFNRKDKMGFATPSQNWFRQSNNLEYFQQFINENDTVFQSLSPWYKDYITSAWNKLASQESYTASTAGEINILWRLFTVNMWAKQL